MIIAHISDLHVVEEGELCQGKVDTCGQLRMAVEHLNRLNPPPDVVIVTGDISEHSTPAEYADASQILAGIRQPVFPIPGNHDRREVFLDALKDKAYLPRPEAPFAHYVVEDYPLRLIGLDTTVPGQPHGMLCDERLDWLDAALAADVHKPALIFMHHPPFPTGIRWIDAAGLHGARKMAAIVARYPQVEWVACGHVHRPIQTCWAGAMASTVPSVSHVQVGLSLSEEEGYDFRLALEPRVMQLYLYEGGRGILSHASYVDGGYETYQAAGAAPRMDEYRQRYATICQAEFDLLSVPDAVPRDG